MSMPPLPVTTVPPETRGFRLRAAGPLPAPVVAHARRSAEPVPRVAVLLLHGFTGSPQSIRPWGEYLAAHGFDVTCPRLPGHGTVWQEMVPTRWSDWYTRAEQEWYRASADHDVVLVAGLSMGGALAIRLAQRHPGLAGVALVNPAIASADPAYRFALPVLSRVLTSIAGVAGDIARPDRLEVGYDRTPLRAAASMVEAWRTIAAELSSYTPPTIIFRSDVDHVVDESGAALLASESPAPLTVRPLARSYHVATLDWDAEAIFADSVAFWVGVLTGREPVYR